MVSPAFARVFRVDLHGIEPSLETEAPLTPETVDLATSAGVAPGAVAIDPAGVDPGGAAYLHRRQRQ